MKPEFTTHSNERGAVLVIAMLMMVACSLIGIAATVTSTIEQNISGNEKFHRMAFYNADSGIYVTAKLISKTIDTGEPLAESRTPGIVYLDSSGNPGSETPTEGELKASEVFYFEIMGFDLTLGRAAYDEAGDVRFLLDNRIVDVDIENSKITPLAGGGAEFGTASEGVGRGSLGAVRVLFNLDSLGHSLKRSRSNIVAQYEKILSIPGGL